MIELVVVILVLGIVAWAVNAFPIPQPFKTVLYALALIFLVVYIANFFGHSPVHFRN